jgi:hypothetical protein
MKFKAINRIPYILMPYIAAIMGSPTLSTCGCCYVVLFRWQQWCCQGGDQGPHIKGSHSLRRMQVSTNCVCSCTKQGQPSPFFTVAATWTHCLSHLGCSDAEPPALGCAIEEEASRARP